MNARAFLLPSTASTGGAPTPPPAPPVIQSARMGARDDGRLAGCCSFGNSGGNRTYSCLHDNGQGWDAASIRRDGRRECRNHSDFWPLMLGYVLALSLCVAGEVLL